MKTTIDISGSIRIKAKRLARDQNPTLRSLAEEGLIKVIEERSARRPYRVNPVTFRGEGLSPEFPAVATHPRDFGARDCPQSFPRVSGRKLAADSRCGV